VAAEKAAEWKRQQLEAEAAKKNKSHIKKRNKDLDSQYDKPGGNMKTIQFSALERELQMLAEQQQ
jgi:hypothetical protein